MTPPLLATAGHSAFWLHFTDSQTDCRPRKLVVSGHCPRMPPILQCWEYQRFVCSFLHLLWAIPAQSLGTYIPVRWQYVLFDVKPAGTQLYWRIYECMASCTFIWDQGHKWVHILLPHMSEICMLNIRSMTALVLDAIASCKNRAQAWYLANIPSIQHHL